VLFDPVSLTVDPKFGLCVPILKFVHLRVIKTRCHKMQIFGSVTRQPVLSWQPCCALPVMGGYSC